MDSTDVQRVTSASRLRGYRARGYPRYRSLEGDHNAGGAWRGRAGAKSAKDGARAPSTAGNGCDEDGGGTGR